MKLYLDGITRITENPNIIAGLKKAGYKEVIDPLPKVETSGLSVAEIYALCEKAGMKPDDLKLESEHPTIAEVKAAIKTAKAGE